MRFSIFFFFLFDIFSTRTYFRIRIDKTGKVLYDKTLARLNSETLETVRLQLAESPIGSHIAEAKEKGQRSWRKDVTGNPQKKIRDFIKEVPQVDKGNMLHKYLY